MPNPDSTEVAVFLDYQNSWHGTRARFGNPDFDPPTVGHVHPDLLGELLCEHGRTVDPQRLLSQVHVYRGRPGWQSHRDLRVAFDRQTARWTRLPGVSFHTRNMRYQATGWSTTGEVTNWVGQEKGIDVLLALDLVRGARLDLYDVAVVVSGDTDLFPAIEEAMSLGKRVERALWWKPPVRKRALHLRGRAVWTHYLDEADFGTVRDDTNYLSKL